MATEVSDGRRARPRCSSAGRLCHAADELRYAWFFIQVSTTFLLLGPQPGWVTAVAIVVMVAVCKRRRLIALSDQEDH